PSHTSTGLRRGNSPPMLFSQLGRAAKSVPVLAKSVWHCISVCHSAPMRFQAIVELKQLLVRAGLELVGGASFFQITRLDLDCQLQFVPQTSFTGSVDVLIHTLPGFAEI